MIRDAALTGGIAAVLLAGCSVGSDGSDAGLEFPDATLADAGAVECARDVDCSDGIECTIDHCEDGVCVPEPCVGCCPDELECSDTLGCTEALVRCTEDSECVDEVRCTLDFCRDGEICDHMPRDGLCEDGEVCLPALGCIPAPPDSCSADEDCTGGNECLGDWSCQPEFGCQFRAPPDCDDGDDCTIDACDLDLGMCVMSIVDADEDGHGADTCGGDDCDDTDPDVSPSALEICDGDDEDCDEIVDEGCCTEGDPCTTSCGTSGTTSCAGGVESCVAVEVCNGMDDDCDGAPDQTFECVEGRTRTCTTSCAGAPGMETCAGCAWSGCVAPTEMCGGGDDDCDGRVDEGFACSPGGSGSCLTTCSSMGTRSCLGDCTWDSCIPPAEVCNGVDDDCDMVCDDTFTCCRGSTVMCSTLGFVSGTATCRTDCSGYDTTGCTDCGDSSIDPGEDCDGSDLGMNDCTTVPGSFGSGTLRCTPGCRFDTTSCSLCRNGTLDSGEECDGTDLGGFDCTTVPGGSFTGGTLGCTSACTFDTSMCSTFDPSGIYDAAPPAAYMCASGLVNYNISSFTFTDDGTTLSVVGARCTMTGPSARISRMISVSCTVTGTCDEVYALSGRSRATRPGAGPSRRASSRSSPARAPTAGAECTR